MGCLPLKEARTILKWLTYLGAELAGPNGSIVQIPNMASGPGSQVALTR